MLYPQQFKFSLARSMMTKVCNLIERVNIPQQSTDHGTKSLLLVIVLLNPALP